MTSVYRRFNKLDLMTLVYTKGSLSPIFQKIQIDDHAMSLATSILFLVSAVNAEPHISKHYPDVISWEDASPNAEVLFCGSRNKPCVSMGAQSDCRKSRRVISANVRLTPGRENSKSH